VLAYIPVKNARSFGSSATSLNLHMMVTHGLDPITAAETSPLTACAPGGAGAREIEVTCKPVAAPAAKREVAETPVTFTLFRLNHNTPPTDRDNVSSTKRRVVCPPSSVNV
jgi:hypothetical protein